jgi:non-specific serine/threonine protein kinase
VTDPDLVGSEIASTLGLREEPGRALLDTVVGYLDRRAALLVIDNCEHVLDAAAAVAAELVVRCPYLKLIATSRQALGVGGEVARPLAPLSAPAISSSPTADELVSYEAVQLLADRASLARDGFEVTDANAAAVAQICRQLDGIPLAIEFAAARLGALGPAELARRLDDRFRLLSSTRRSGPERHQTLDAAVDWSYELLGDGERLLFRRLAVLNGRFSLEGAETVCADDVLPTTEIAELLSRLVDGSLVSADTRGDETSYRMLATIRAFALARLEESGEEDAMRANHLRYLVHLAERIEPELVGADQARLLDVLASVHDDTRAALAWGVRAEPREALRLAVAMTPFWYTRGHWTEGRRRLEETMAAAPEPSVELATALRGAGNLANEQGETEQARVLFERALDLYGRFEDEEGKVLVLTSLGNLAASTGDREKAKELFDESLALVRRGGHQRRIVGMLINLATSAQARGDESAEGLYHEALSLSREHGHTRGVAGALVGLGTIAQGAGDIDRARGMYHEALELFTELGDKMGTAAALSSLGNTARARGDLDEAFALLTRALPLHRELGDRRAAALALSRLGTVAWARADLAAAADLHAQALGAFRELGDVAGVVASLASLARVARTTDDERSALAWLDQALDACRRAPEMRATATCLEELAGLTVREDPERAARLFGAAEAIRRSTGASGIRTGQATYERDVAGLKERLPAPEVERLWTAGRSMPAAEAVAYASKVAVPG